MTAVKPAGKININTADEAALTSLKGIGKTKAKAIIDYRQQNGPFKTVDDLTKVKGIGDKTLAALRAQLTTE
jgi:competence protein ComEA